MFHAMEYQPSPPALVGFGLGTSLVPLAVNDMQLKGEKNNFKGDYRGREWAGATFSPDGQWLFVNIQTPGLTLAITGPWESLEEHS